MALRILLVLLKSALLVALAEALRPIADLIGVHLGLIGPLASAISQFAGLPYRESEFLLLMGMATTLLKIAKPIWDLIKG